MNYIINDNKINLLQYWLLNLKKNINNEEILLITFRNISLEKSFSLFSEMQNMITSSYIIKTDQIINLIDLEHINQIDDNKNIILINMHSNDNINKFENCNKKILHIKFNLYNIRQLRKLFNIIQNLELLNKLQVEQSLDYLFYIEKRDPLLLMKQNSSSIINLISTFNFKILKSNKTVPDKLWIDNITEETHILRLHKILTSQLAVAIYRASTLQFSDSSTKIGIFYRKNLGVKSKTIHLPDIYNRKIKLNIKIKGYNLNSIKTTD